MKKPLIVNCPNCAEPVQWVEENSFRPFCGELCKQIDLGAWASEEYAIPSEQQDEWELSDAVSEAASSKLQ